ncbi:MAG: toll/interleukin-1 receptor domain-containing protein [Pseudomonadota bacterium]
MENYDIFISYRTTHSDWVETLAHNLKSHGYSVFLDRWVLIPGQDFPRNIHQALNNARCAILVATPDASDSGWVQQELDLMLSLKNSRSGFFFIPVVMGQFPDLPFLETVQAVDFGDSSPENYRRAFRRLICGLEQKPPGPEKEFTGDLKLPQAETADRRTLAKSGHDFLEQVFTLLKSGQPLIILAQADTTTQIYGRALRDRAETLYGPENVLHIFPPNSTRADNSAYFGRLAKQCRFNQSIGESWQWADALAEKLESGPDLFLLVTGFENGVDSARAELAGELRQLNERYPGFRPVMLGGEKLAALKYAHGNMSLLNIAEELMIPEPDSTDFEAIFGQIYSNLQQSTEQLEAILTFTGGHPRLLCYCLQHGADSAQSCEQVLRDSPLPAQLFTRFRDERTRVPLITLLKQKQLGRFDPWPSDELLRKLYWNNLITRKGQNFIWRCELIRKLGLEIVDR